MKYASTNDSFIRPKLLPISGSNTDIHVWNDMNTNTFKHIIGFPLPIGDNNSDGNEEAN